MPKGTWFIISTVINKRQKVLLELFKKELIETNRSRLLVKSFPFCFLLVVFYLFEIMLLKWLLMFF